jgi:hypothetical protein
MSTKRNPIVTIRCTYRAMTDEGRKQPGQELRIHLATNSAKQGGYQQQLDLLHRAVRVCSAYGKTPRGMLSDHGADNSERFYIIWRAVSGSSLSSDNTSWISAGAREKSGTNVDRDRAIRRLKRGCAARTLVVLRTYRSRAESVPYRLPNPLRLASPRRDSARVGGLGSVTYWLFPVWPARLFGLSAWIPESNIRCRAATGRGPR